jgi:hypothetical protein
MKQQQQKRLCNRESTQMNANTAEKATTKDWVRRSKKKMMYAAD